MKLRRLNRSEMTLLIVCAVAILGVGNFILWKEYSDRARVAHNKIQIYGEEEESNIAAATDVEFWAGRQAWLDQHMPAMGDPGQAQSELLEFVQSSGAERGLKITSSSLVKPEGGPHYKELAVSVSASGPDQALFRWLAEMQSPEKFYYVKAVQLNSESGGAIPRMNCRLTLARWFK